MREHMSRTVDRSASPVLLESTSAAPLRAAPHVDSFGPRFALDSRDSVYPVTNLLPLLDSCVPDTD